MQPLGDEDKLFLARIEDAVSFVSGSYTAKYIGFLNEHQLALALSYLKAVRFERFLTFGGYVSAERQFLGLFPEYEVPDIASFPIQSLIFAFRKEDHLSHRDFLGSFLSLGLKREAIGDIMVTEGTATVFVTPVTATLIRNEIQKIGRTGVRIVDQKEIMITEPKTVLQKGTVASMRLDCLVSFLAKVSREEASRLILSGKVFVDGAEVLSVSQNVSQGSKLSIRGCGKFMIEKIGSLTKKGRIAIEALKYV